MSDLKLANDVCRHHIRNNNPSFSFVVFLRGQFNFPGQMRPGVCSARKVQIGLLLKWSLLATYELAYSMSNTPQDSVTI